MKRRLPAEWEAQSGVQFTFPHAGTDWADMLSEAEECFADIIRVAARFEKVLVVCRDAKYVAKILCDIPSNRLQLVQIDSDDTWARDHAAITVMDQHRPLLLDFTFNGWGGKFPAERDNRINRQLFEKGIFQRHRFQSVPLVLEGGSIETDGAGTLLTTTQCLLSPNRNPHLTKVELEQSLRQYLGIDRFLWLAHGELEGDDTDAHIDTLARFCAPDTIAYVACYNPVEVHYASLQKMEAELQQLTTPDGGPYRLIPLPLPEPCLSYDGHRLPATYANFLILNGAVLVPFYRVPQDEEALEQLRKCFPDRAVIGVNARPLIEQHGSLHCISMQFPLGVI